MVEFTDKKGKRQRLIEAVPLYLKTEIENNLSVLTDFYKNVLNLQEPIIIINGIKKNSLFKINGFPVHLRGTTGFSGSQLLVQNAAELSLPKQMENYVKKLENYEKHRSEERSSVKNSQVKISKWDGITETENMILYDEFIEKLEKTIYRFRPANQLNNLKKCKEIFKSLSVEEQCLVLNQIQLLFACKPITADLTLINCSKRAGNMAFSKNISSNDSVFMINQSITGLFEQKIDLLKIETPKK